MSGLKTLKAFANDLKNVLGFGVLSAPRFCIFRQTILWRKTNMYVCKSLHFFAIRFKFSIGFYSSSTIDSVCGECCISSSAFRCIMAYWEFLFGFCRFMRFWICTCSIRVMAFIGNWKCMTRLSGVLFQLYKYEHLFWVIFWNNKWMMDGWIKSKGCRVNLIV